MFIDQFMDNEWNENHILGDCGTLYTADLQHGRQHRHIKLVAKVAAFL